MSGFLKRTKTVNPAGGVNPASSPNVSQYGWTSYDAGNVNQIIEYVNMAKASAQSAKDSADYVQSKIGELEDTLDRLEDFLQDAGPIFSNIEVIYADILQKHTEVTTMHSDVSTALAGAVQASSEAKQASTIATAESVKSADAATRSATSATASEASNVGSKGWYDKSKDLYDALQAGQVYRGTWNPTTNVYPTKPNTNSAWDVSLPSGTASHTFDGKVWRSGDRLLFALATNAFEQLAVGGGVDSVNGKSGAVTLNAADVGAVAKTGGEVTGSINANAPSKQITFKNTNNYISMGGDDLYLSAINGATSRVVLQSFRNPLVSIAVTPGSPAVNNYEIYHKGNVPTAAEVKAVGLSGAQTMTGQLNGVKYTATDPYAYVSRLRGNQGMYLGNAANDTRTIIGGGGEAVGDATGSVIIRPNGITDTAGELLISASGNVASAAAPTANTHLTNKVYVDTSVKTLSDRVDAIGPDAINAMPKTGGVFTGPVTGVVGTKSAMTFANKASIRYYDGSGTHFHNFAEGNALYWKTGGAGENAAAYLTSAGIFNTEGVIYGKTGVISQSRNSATWLGMEAPETGGPYISSKAEGETGAVLSMRFGKSEVSVESGKRFTASHVRVVADGGLQFSADAAMSGITWAMGVNPNSRSFGIYQYNNGAYGGQYFNIDPSSGGGTTISGRKVKITGDTEMSGYASITGAGNNGLEFHQPGNTATFVYKPMGRNALRIGQGNGAAGEVQNFADIDVNQAAFRGKVSSNHQSSRGWGSAGDSVFYGGGSTVTEGALSSLVAQWVTVPNRASYEHGYGFLSDSSGNIGNYGHALWCQDSSSYNKYWVFRNNGGQQSPSGFRIEGDGRMAGKAYEGYEDHFHWMTASLASTSDANLKTVVGDSVKSALDVVNQFQFKRFVWNEEAGSVYTSRNKKLTDIGLIAQQVEEVDPSLVKTISVGGDTPTETKTLDTAAMLALAMKAIQEQQVQINELKEKLNEFIQQ